MIFCRPNPIPTTRAEVKNAKLDKSTPRIFSPIIINNKNKTILDINDILLIVFELNIDEFKLDNLLIPLSAKSITKPVTEKNAVERNANLIPS